MAKVSDVAPRRGAAPFGSPQAAAGSAAGSGATRARQAGYVGGGGAARVPLSRERILTAAFRLVDERGLAGLTIRRLGETLGCEAMSIYHHVPSKQHLLDAMVESAIASIPEPGANLDLIDRLRFIGREYRAMAHRYPRLFPLIALHRLNMPAGVAFIERMLHHFRAVVPDDRLAAQAFRIFGYYVIGAALDETAGYAKGPSAAIPVVVDEIARAAPLLAEAAPSVKSTHFDSTFEFGFEIMLKGIADLRATLIGNARPAPKPVVRPKA